MPSFSRKWADFSGGAEQQASREEVMNSDRMSVVGVILAAFLLPVAGAQAVVRYVALDGTGTDGLTWATAYNTIQAAIDDPLMVGGGEIWVKQGVYALPRAIEVRKAVRIYGGFSGVGNTRDWTAFQTTVNGAERAGHCFYVIGNATVDGFGIARGTGLGADPNGAGVLVDNRTATITNCLFAKNSTIGSGGGIATYNADGTKIANCQFSSNQVSGRGGAIYNQGGTGLQILNCTFAQNWTNDSGGAIYNRDCDVTIDGCVFQGNQTAPEDSCVGGAIWNEGGSPTIRNCSFVANRASYGAGICNSDSDATIQDCWFAYCGGSATRGGGGICNDGGAPTILGCQFEENSAEWLGGAIADLGSAARVINCIMLRNTATVGGGGIYLLERWGNTGAPGPQFINCTLQGNRSSQEGGAVFSEDVPSTFFNCIIWGNSAGSGAPGIHSQAGASSGRPAVRYCDVEGSSVYPGTGNIRMDPRLVDPDTNDVSLLFDSPCVDAGSNSAVAGISGDFDGRTRVVDGDGDGTAVVDMGAFELQVAGRHLIHGEILQALVYASPDDSSGAWMHMLRLETDSTVTSVDFQSPHDSTWCTIPSDSHTSSGNVDTYHFTEGKTDVWEYLITASDPAGLAKFDQGLYRIVAHYWNGTEGETQVNYVVPGTGNPIPQPTQKPQISAPADGATVGSPVTIRWSACTDSAANGIYVTVDDADSGQEVENQVLPLTATASNLLLLNTGTYDAEVRFAHLYDNVASTDGTPFRCSKAALVGLHFTVPYKAVYRFWAQATDRHFYTANEKEKDKLIANYSDVWTFEGIAYNAATSRTNPRMLPVYRFWSGKAHFYTINEAEKNKLINEYSHLWTPEGIAFYAFPEGAEPPECRAVYRFWNATGGTHFFTINDKEASKLITQYSHVYTYEGVAFYAYPP
jgi:predicted outer membrane repeat protein